MSTALFRAGLIVTGALLLGGAFFLAKQVAGDGNEPDEPTSALGSTSAAGSSRADSKQIPAWEQFLVTPSEGEEPPLRSVLRAKEAVPSPFDRGFARKRLVELNLRLQGVGRGGEAGGVALVSGQRLRVGDSIDVFRVVSIRPTAVSLVGPMGVRIDLAPRPPDEGEEGESGATPDDPAAAAAAAFEEALREAEREAPRVDEVRPETRPEDIR